MEAEKFQVTLVNQLSWIHWYVVLRKEFSTVITAKIVGAGDIGSYVGKTNT